MFPWNIRVKILSIILIGVILGVFGYQLFHWHRSFGGNQVSQEKYQRDLYKHNTDALKPDIKAYVSHGIRYTIVTYFQDKDGNGVSYLQLTSGLDSHSIESINTAIKKDAFASNCFGDPMDKQALFALRNQLLERVESQGTEGLGYTKEDISQMSYEDVKKHLEENFGFFDSESIENVFLTDRILSFNTSFSVFCGGAYGDDGAEGVTFDLTTGKKMTFPDLFADFTKDKNKIAQAVYRYGNKEAEGDDGNEVYQCDYFQDWQDGDIRIEHTNYRFDKDGLMILGFDYSHVQQVCNREFRLPYSIIAPYLKKEWMIPSGTL